MARYPGGPKNNPTRRALGHYPTLSLAKARAKAVRWREWIAEGKDPAVEIERQRAAEQRKLAATFDAVAEAYIRDGLNGQRKAYEIARDIRRVFIPAWGKRPIADIVPIDVRNLIRRYADQGKLYQSYNLLSYVRCLFRWAVEQHVYGLEVSPCDSVKPRSIIGKKEPRSRTLSDQELRAAWLAAEQLGYPYFQVFRLLMLTGLRRGEVLKARWSEFDLQKKLWVVPAERMKAGAAHVVPLCDDALAIIRGLDRHAGGPCLFSIRSAGKKPANSIAKGKVLLDKYMLDILREDDPAAELRPFQTHDLRRTMRTGLSAIPSIPDLVRELVIAHSKPGLHKVYDQHAYLDEKRHALDAWAARLRSIVNSPPANVEDIEAQRQARVS
jgi:integrase